MTGQLTKIVDNLDRNRDRLFEFDSLARLKTAKGGVAAGASGVTANWTQSYSYDRYGNKTGVTASGVDQNNATIPADGLTSLSFNTANNRTNTAGWEYDLAGNLVRGQNAGGVWQRFEYDAAGRVKKVKDDLNNVLETYTYGAGREKLFVVSSTTGTTYYVWGGSSIICEYKLLKGVPSYTKSYIYAGSRLLMTATRTSAMTEKKETHHPDRLGTKLVTDTGAGSNYRQSTLPFGTALAAESTGYSNQVFTSYDRSSTTGLDYATNRTYSQGQSRFTQPDPIGMASASIGNPQSNNLYAYTQNMPTDYTDPSGLLLIQQCTRNWVDYGDGGGRHYSSRTCVTIYDDSSGGGGDAAFTTERTAVKNLCDRVAQILKPHLNFFEDLWKASGSGTNTKIEQGGVIGLGAVQLGGVQSPVSATFGGRTYEANMGKDFTPWVRELAKSIEVLFWVHTHPNGTSLPSPLGNFGGETGDKKVASTLGIDGILVTGDKLGVFNEVGNYCLFRRTSSGLSPTK